MSVAKTYGLIGKTLGHSFSQKYFAKKFDNQTIKCRYLNFELNNINDIKKVFQTEGLSGLNVTIPYKESVIPYLDDLDPIAEEVGAVNTIQFRDGKKIGYNTDVYGFKQMIKPFFKSHHERAMILGTGGASKAVAHVLEELGCEIIYISRNPKGENQFSYDDINENMVALNKFIINTTPLGTYPNLTQMPNVPIELVSTNHLVVDLIYNPPKTKFLQIAQEHGAVILDGLTMLEQQAEKSWEIWNE